MKFKVDFFGKLNSSNRNFGLDFLRSLAILLVLFAHFGISEVYTSGINIGSLGVEIFFVLSGFLIGQILIKDLSRSLTARSILNFWIRRWFRTLPLYYMVILLKFILIDHSLGFKILVYFFFLQNNFVGIDFMPVTWSLVVEEWFYLTLPVLLFVFFYKREMKARPLMFFILGFIVFENIARLVFVLYTDRTYAAIAGNFPFRLDSMMCGVLLANLRLNVWALYEKLSSVKVFAITLLLYCFLLFCYGHANLIEGKVNQLVWTRSIWFSLNSFFIALLIPFIEQKISVWHINNFFRLIITSISVFSYCAYLIHMEVYSRILNSTVFTKGWFIQSFLCFFLTFLISAVVYFTFEKPMTDIRDQFGKNRKHN